MLSKSAMATPENNILLASLFADFQESLRATYKTRKDAFDKLGGDDDGRIELKELHEFLSRHGYDNSKLNQQLFRYIDADDDGYITRVEFKLLFQGETADLTEFKESLKEFFKSRQRAFEDLGGRDDGEIDLAEFSAFLCKNLGYKEDPAKMARLFKTIDVDNDGSITKGEFKALFQPEGETAQIIEFKDKLKHMFKSRKQAFDKLGGSDDAQIDKVEFGTFLREELGYANKDMVHTLFRLIDDDNDGTITKAEFEALFLRHTVKLVEIRDNLKQALKEKFKSRQKAFDKLGGQDDSKIDRAELRRFMREEMNVTDEEQNDQLFSWIDTDGNGTITLAEFKEFF